MVRIRDTEACGDKENKCYPVWKAASHPPEETRRIKINILCKTNIKPLGELMFPSTKHEEKLPAEELVSSWAGGCPAPTELCAWRAQGGVGLGGLPRHRADMPPQPQPLPILWSTSMSILSPQLMDF